MSSTRTAQRIELANDPFDGRVVGGSRTWALDVADDGAGLVVHELYADLGDTTTRTCRFSSRVSRPPSRRGGGRIGAYRCARERG